MTKIRKLFSNSVSGSAAKFLNALIQLVSLPILLKVYGKEGYGLLAIAMSFNTLIAILQLGLPAGIPKFVAEWVAKKDYSIMQKATSSVFSFYLVLAFINLALILIVRYFFVDYFKISIEQAVIFKELLIITAVVSFISIPLNYLDQLLSGVQEIVFISKQQMFKNLMFACLVLFVFLKPNSLTLVQFYAINCLIMLAFIPSKVKKWLKYGTLKAFIPKWYFKEILPLLKYCLQLFIMGLFIMMADKLKPLILSLRASNDAAVKMADYQIIYNVVMFLGMIAASIIAALIPYVSSEYILGNTEIYKKVIQNVTKPVWAFGALVVFIMILLSNELLIIYVGPANLYLRKWLILFLIGSLYILYTPCISAVVLASGRTSQYTIGTAIACLISLAVCWFLVPITAMGGMIYAFIAYIFILFSVVHFYYLRRIFGISPINQITKVFLPPIAAGICMFFCIRYLLDLLNIANPYSNILVGTITGSLLYSAIILIIYIKPKDVKLFFNHIIFRQTLNDRKI
jgi:O-antigen/teichoic acid export membrane protein